jgi:uncharacterized membrane protein YobD (UPF0266 family)
MRVLCPTLQVTLYYRGKYDSAIRSAIGILVCQTALNQSCFVVSHAAFHVQTDRQTYEIYTVCDAKWMLCTSK